ncbi:MAG: hypothetical protein DDT38_00677 [Firmicutes bacterium]|nr:hypothetical protein [candidate division NPL-UPA2 bacterium]
MEVIYCCYAGAHTSVTAAGIHVGLLPILSRPSAHEILSLPNFDQGSSRELGRVLKFGEDEYGNSVYVAGLGPSRAGTLAALRLVLTESQVSADAFCIVDTLQCISLPVCIGGFLSRRCGYVSLGRPMCVYGILTRYYCFVRLVSEVKAVCRA